MSGSESMELDSPEPGETALLGNQAGTRASTEAQQAIWLACQLDPRAATAFSDVTVLELRGDVNLSALHGAVDRVIARHEALRTRFTEDGASICVAPPAQVASVLREVPEAAEFEPGEIIAWLREEAGRGFDLCAGPLVRLHYLPRSDGGILVLTTHQLVCDEASRETVWRELGEAYSARCAGREPGASGPACQMSWYAEYESRLRADGSGAAAAEFWRRMLAHGAAQPELPADRPRPARPSYAGDSCRLTLDATSTEAIRTLAREQGSSLFALLFAAMGVLTYRLSGTREFVVGLPVAGQSIEGAWTLVGHCARLLPVAQEIDPASSLAVHARRVHETLASAMKHAGEFSPRAAREHQPAFTPAQPWPFGLVFSVTHGPELPEFAGLKTRWATGPRRHFFGELAWQVIETEQELVVEARFNTDLYDVGTVKRWLHHFATLIAGWPRERASSIDRVAVLEESERREIVETWNPAPLPVVPHAWLLQRAFETHVERNPSHPALETAGESLTYEILNTRANQLARHLIALGAGPDQCIALLVPRSPAYAIGALGILKAGAAFVPIDPEWPAERQAFVLRDCGARALVTAGLRPAGELPDSTRVVDLQAEGDFLAQLPAHAPVVAVAPHHLAYVIYTSGSTGQPKGVMIPHRAAALHMAGIAGVYRIVGDDRCLLFHSVAFDPAVEQLFAPLTVGATVFLRGEELWNGREFSTFVRQRRITAVTLSPLYWLQLLRDWAQHPGLAPLGQLRRVLVGGEALPCAAVQLWRELGLTSIRLLNGYGPTECTITATIYDVPPRASAAEAGGRVPLGRPQGPVEAYVLDDHLQPQPIGVAGELCLAGPTLARGYLGREALTRERFVDHPFRPGHRLYRTGDRARFLADGTLEFLGRSDRQIKIGGYRVEPGEIENHLAALPGVRASAVVPDRKADGSTALTAYYVPATVGAPERETLFEALRERLPGYMVPARILAVPHLPQTINGKLDLSALRELGAAAEAAAGGPADAPRSELEEIVHEIWRGALGRDACGVHEDFFAMGGSSLAAMRVTGRLREALSLDVPARCLFEHPTIARMARALEELLLAELADPPEHASARSPDTSNHLTR